MGHLWNDGSEDLSLRNDAMLGFNEMDIWYEQYWLWTLGCQVHGGVPKHAMFMWLVVAMTPPESYLLGPPDFESKAFPLL